MNIANKYSTLGGLIGVILSESAINIMNPAFDSQVLRLSLDLYNYAAGAGIGSLVYLDSIKNNIDQLTQDDLGYVVNNVAFPVIIAAMGSFYT